MAHKTLLELLKVTPRDRKILAKRVDVVTHNNSIFVPGKECDVYTYSRYTKDWKSKTAVDFYETRVEFLNTGKLNNISDADNLNMYKNNDNSFSPTTGGRAWEELTKEEQNRISNIPTYQRMQSGKTQLTGKGTHNRSPRNQPVDNKMDRSKLIPLVSCSCLDFKFTWETVLHQTMNANIVFSNGSPPMQHNSLLLPGLCKHLYLVCYTLMMTPLADQVDLGFNVFQNGVILHDDMATYF